MALSFFLSKLAFFDDTVLSTGTDFLAESDVPSAVGFLAGTAVLAALSPAGALPVGEGVFLAGTAVLEDVDFLGGGDFSSSFDFSFFS